jgi:protoheme IX farnesyltransferase
MADYGKWEKVEEKTMRTISIWSKSARLREFWVLTKPRVVLLIVFCAMIGMLLATPGLPDPFIFVMANIGIGCVASAAAAINCLVEQKIDARMARTSKRPLPRGVLHTTEALVFAICLGLLGMVLLYGFVNLLTMWLTVATFVGYAVVYTIVLKPATPQNIVIGGASGAMPPLLGWAAMTGTVTYESMLLFLIIFAWTPPHFWSLALYRQEDYAKAGLPMLPVTHGRAFTQLYVLLYTIILILISLLPVAAAMFGLLYLSAALVLGGIYLYYAIRLWREYSDSLARKAFRYSIWYLMLLFFAMLLDHYFPVLWTRV